jgi:hypothetical protein
LCVNSAVATGITTGVIKNFGNQNLCVTNNTCIGDVVSSIPLDLSVPTYGAITATIQYWYGNQTSSGWYRSGAVIGSTPTEYARFRIENTNGGSLTATQVSGVKCFISVIRSGNNFNISSVGNAGEDYKIAFVPHCNATTASNPTAMTHMTSYTYTHTTSTRIITMNTYAPAAGAVTLSSFSFAAGGNTGTFFVDVLF